MVQVKICGLRTAEQVQMAIQAGADAVGWVLYEPSPRAVTLEQAIQLQRVCPVFTQTVALLVNPTAAFVHDVIQRLRPSLLQFHGDESYDFCEQFAYPYLRSVPVGSTHLSTPAKVLQYVQAYPHARGFIFDTPSVHYGGTGQIFDHQLLLQILAEIPVTKRIIAGGINATNVQSIVQLLQPAAVDLSSGVESAKGVKCPHLLQQFFHALRPLGTTEGNTT